MYRNCPEHSDIECANRTGYSRSTWEALRERYDMGHCHDGEGVYDEDDNSDCHEEEEVYD